MHFYKKNTDFKTNVVSGSQKTPIIFIAEDGLLSNKVSRAMICSYILFVLWLEPKILILPLNRGYQIVLSYSDKKMDLRLTN